MSGQLRHAAQTAGYAVTPLFALYNGALGLLHGSVWHGSICGYYLLLSCLRYLLLAAERKRHRAPGDALDKKQGIFYLTWAILLVMNVALAAPVALMVLDRRPVRLGLIPAIATAAYTAYKITIASVRLKRTGGSPFTRQLGRLGFVDALVSILILQNTLLTTIDGSVTAEMLPLVAVSSAAILLTIFGLSLFWLLRDTGRP